MGGERKVRVVKPGSSVKRASARQWSIIYLIVCDIVMRMRVVLLFLMCVPLAAQSSVPRYEVKRVAKPILISGKLDDPAWKSAAAVEFIFPWEFQTGAKQKTTAKLLWDDRYLYVGYDCQDTDIVAVHTERDDPTYLDDAVEIFLNPRPSQTGIYYGMEMNARGVLYDYLMYDASYALKRFNLGGVKLLTNIRGTLNARGDQDSGWTLEVAIPWENFEELAKRPVNGTVWTANMNRWDGTEPNRRLSQWSNSEMKTPNPHAPKRFGELVFVE
jgi:Carbohydrate family 9 binding domain-like